MSKLTYEELVSIFTSPRNDHPGRRGGQRPRSKMGKAVSGNSKWHRRMLAAGMKPTRNK